MGDVQLAHPLAAAFGHFLRRHGVGLRQYQHKLLATKTRHAVTRAHRHCVEGLRHAAQAVVALDMPVVVVELLEVIDIQQDQ
ncbi:hypothetical protein D3C85_1781600 [compost metagenome]